MMMYNNDLTQMPIIRENSQVKSNKLQLKNKQLF